MNVFKYFYLSSHSGEDLASVWVCAWLKESNLERIVFPQQRWLGIRKLCGLKCDHVTESGVSEHTCRFFILGGRLAFRLSRTAHAPLNNWTFLYFQILGLETVVFNQDLIGSGLKLRHLCLCDRPWFDHWRDSPCRVYLLALGVCFAYVIVKKICIVAYKHRWCMTINCLLLMGLYIIGLGLGLDHFHLGFRRFREPGDWLHEGCLRGSTPGWWRRLWRSHTAWIVHICLLIINLYTFK